MLPPLNQRHLRLSLDGAYTEYRYYKGRPCGLFNKFTCYDQEVIIKDFDFNKQEDRQKFNDMGFDCSVRKRP